MLELKNINKDFLIKDENSRHKNPFLDYFFGKKIPKRVIHDINFKIHEGEIVGYIGTNGAGKVNINKNDVWDTYNLLVVKSY